MVGGHDRDHTHHYLQNMREIKEFNVHLKKVSNMLVRMWLFLVLTIFIPSNAKATSLFKHPIPPREFHWKASLNSETGRASAVELSELYQKRKRTRNLETLAEELFEPYPRWLSDPKVVFGLLRTKPYKSEKGERGWAIQDVFLGKNLLIFGKIKSHHVESADNQLSNGKKKGALDIPVLGNLLALQFLAPAVRPAYFAMNVFFYEKNKRTPKKIRSTKKTTTFDYPIIGGLLATTPKESNSPNDYGCIRFSLVEEKVQDPFQSHPTQYHVYLKSEVVDYTPAIAGCAPVPSFRQILYCNSQPFVHAYVMWRYHRRCRNIVNEGKSNERSVMSNSISKFF